MLRSILARPLPGFGTDGDEDRAEESEPGCGRSRLDAPVLYAQGLDVGHLDREIADIEEQAREIEEQATETESVRRDR